MLSGSRNCSPENAPDIQAVREEQARNLFGSGIHPDAEQVLDAYMETNLKPGTTKVQRDRAVAPAKRAVKLGQKFPEYETLEPFKDRVAKRLGLIESETGQSATAADTAKVKREEVSQQRTSVTGYDLAFSPVKSVSILFGLHSDERVCTEVKAAHDAAVARQRLASSTAAIALARWVPGRSVMPGIVADAA